MTEYIFLKEELLENDCVALKKIADLLQPQETSHIVMVMHKDKQTVEAVQLYKAKNEQIYIHIGKKFNFITFETEQNAIQSGNEASNSNS